jgi:hypothetical protein
VVATRTEGTHILDVTRLDPVLLRKCMRLAFDVVMAHRVVRGMPLDVQHITRLREALEQRVVDALAETDDTSMPSSWSWEKAAEALAMQVALALVEAQKGEAGSAGP